MYKRFRGPELENRPLVLNVGCSRFPIPGLARSPAYTLSIELALAKFVSKDPIRNLRYIILIDKSHKKFFGCVVSCEDEFELILVGQDM